MGRGQLPKNRERMKLFFALLVGIAVGAAAVWFYNTDRGRSRVQAASDQIESTAKSARNAVQDKLRVLDLRSDDIKDELARTGQVVRRKAREARQRLADAGADSRITTAIKGKLVADRALPALSISVNTTTGVVTLSRT